MVFLGRVMRKSWGFALALGLGCAGPVLATSDGTPPAEPSGPELPSNCIGKVLATALHLERDLVAARRDVTERVRKSPNARAIADFIPCLLYTSVVEPVAMITRSASMAPFSPAGSFD